MCIRDRLEVGGLTAAHVLDPVPHDVLLDDLLRLLLPIRLVRQVMVAADVVQLLRLFLSPCEIINKSVSILRLKMN